jgi:antitoxin ParD1/3/4
MRTTQQLSITLPLDMAEMVRAKVSAGLYASESEVIRDGLRVLLARDQAVEDWLRGDVAAAFDRTAADPDRAVSADEVRARIAQRAREGTDAAGQ